MEHWIRDKSHRQGGVHTATVAIAAIALGAVALLWGWNTVAADLLGLPVAKYVHALSFEIALVTLLLTGRSAIAASLIVVERRRG